MTRRGMLVPKRPWPTLLPVLVLVLITSTAPALSQESVWNVGQPVPEFSLPGLDGNPVSFLGQIRGKAPLTVLFFMTTACSACYEELQEMNKFVREHPGRIDLWCVAVDLRGSKTVAPYQKAHRFQANYLIDTKFSLPRAFGFNYTPSLVILDRDGVVLHKKGGYSPNESLPDLIRSFLR